MITVDDRELKEYLEHWKVLSVAEFAELLGVPIVVERLNAGDFAFLDRYDDPVGIERCEVGNLIQKLRSGELEEQLIKCDEHYKTVFLLTEGVYDHYSKLLAVYKQYDRGYFRNHIYPTTQYDYIIALLVRLDELGIRLIHSPNFECSMMAVRAIYNQRTKPEEEHSLFKRIRPIKIPVKLSSNPAVPRLMALCSRLPEKVAIRLINRYDTIWNVLNAEDSELLGIEGLGKGLLDKLKKGVGKDVET